MEERAALFDVACRHRDWVKAVADRAREHGWPAADPVLLAADRASETLSVMVSAVFEAGQVLKTSRQTPR
jgi:hypothetical protein